MGGGRRPRAARLAGAADERGVVVIPAPGDAGSGPPIRARAPITPGRGPRRCLPPSARARPASHHGDQHGGHPPPAGALPAGGHGAHRGHRDGDALDRRRGRPGLERLGLPGLPGPRPRGRAPRRRVAAARQWQRLLEMRALELAAGGRFIAAIPASPAPCPDRTGVYVEIVGDMNRLLADWCRAGRIGADTVAAVVVPVWARTLDEIRAPFEAGGGRVADLELETPSSSVSTTLLARRSRRVRARLRAERERMGGPLLLRPSHGRARHAAPVFSPTSSENSRSASRLPPIATAGTTSRPSSSAEGGPHRARAERREQRPVTDLTNLSARRGAS